MRFFYAAIFVTVLAILPLFSGVVRAQGALPAPVIAIVDFPHVVRQSKAAKSVRTQIDKIRKTYEAEVQGIEGQLRQADQELARQRSVLPKEEFDKRRRAFEKKFRDAQREVQTRQRKLEQAYGQSLRQIEAKLLDIIAELADMRKINLVLGKSAIVIATPAFDLSAQVLKTLDSRLGNVKVPDPNSVTLPK